MGVFDDVPMAKQSTSSGVFDDVPLLKQEVPQQRQEKQGAADFAATKFKQGALNVVAGVPLIAGGIAGLFGADDFRDSSFEIVDGMRGAANELGQIEADGIGAQAAGVVAGVAPALMGFAVNPSAGIASSMLPSFTDGADSVARGLSNERAIANVMVDAAINKLGVDLPAGIGSTVAKRLASGVGINVGTGMVGNEAKSLVAGDNKAVADKYAHTVESVIADALFGAAGAAHGAAGVAKTNKVMRNAKARNSEFRQQALVNEQARQDTIAQQYVEKARMEAEQQAQQAGAQRGEALASTPLVIRGDGLSSKLGVGAADRIAEQQAQQLAETPNIIMQTLNPQGLGDLPTARDSAIKANDGMVYSRESLDPLTGESVPAVLDNTGTLATDGQQFGELRFAQNEVDSGKAKQAFDIADLRQKRADADLATNDTIAQDYQGGLSAAKGGVVNGDQRGAMMVGDNEFTFKLDEAGTPIADKDGNVFGTLKDADGNTFEAWVKPNQIKEFKAPANQRLAQDFMARSSQQQDGVGTGTRAQEKMPDRSTDTISGDVYGGKASPLAAPYNAAPREPSGKVSVEQAPKPQEPSGKRGATVDNEFDGMNKPQIEDANGLTKKVFSQKQKLIASASKIYEAADGLEGKAKADLIKQAQKIEAQAAKIEAAEVKGAPVVKESLTTEQAPQKSQKNSKPKKRSLLTALRDAGGIKLSDKLDITGEGGRFVGGGYNQLFKSASKTSLKGHIENGTLDEFLPYNMRLEANGMRDDAFDSTEAYDYLSEKIRNGDSLLTYEAEQEIQRNAYYENQTAQEAVKETSQLSDDEINALLQEAGYDERENNTENQIFEQGNPDSTTAGSEGVEARDADADGNAEPSDFTLERETNEQILAREQAQKDADAKKAKADAKAKAEEDKRALEAHQRKNASERPFEFGEDNKKVEQAVKSGSEDLFSQPKEQTVAKETKTSKAIDESMDDGSDYDDGIEQVKRDIGLSGGGTFYSGLPIDKMYEAVNGALKKLFSAEFFENQRAETEARRRAFAAAEEADKKASGSDKGGVRRTVEVATQSLNSLITGQTAILDALAKKHNSPTVQKIANMFSDRAGTGDAAASGKTYYQEVEQHFTSRLNGVVAAIGEKRMGDETFWKVVVAKIKSGNTEGGEAGKAAKAIAKLLSDELERMRQAGVDVGDYKNYYPDREINLQAVLNNTDEFVDAATNAFVKNGESRVNAREKAEAWVKHILMDNSDASGSPFMPNRSGSPDTSFTKSRSLSNDASQVLRDAGFYFDNPLESLTTYFYRTSRKTAYENRFGGKTEDGKGHAKYRELEAEILKEGNGKILEEVRAHIISMLGEIPASDVRSRTRKAVSYLQTLNVLTYLSGVGTLLTSLPEPVLAGARTNNLADVPKSVYYSVRNIASRSAQKFLPSADWVKNLSTEQSVEVAEMIGLMANKMLSDSSIQNRLGGNMVNRKADLAVQTALRWNGLHGFTRLTRAASVEVGAKFISSLSREIASNKAGKLTKDLLLEMGIPAEKQAEFAKYVNEADKGAYGGLSIDELGKTSEMNEMYRTALYKFSTQVIQNPNKGQQPRLASHPVGKVAYGLMSYTYAYHENVLKRAGRHAFAAGKDIYQANIKGKEAEYNYTERMRLLVPTVVAMGLVPLMQMALMPVRDLLNGVTDDQKEKRKNRKVLGVEGDKIEAFQRSGALGRYDPVFNAVMGLRHDREITTFLYGAAGSGILNTGEKVLGFGFDDKNSPNTNSYERSLANSIMSTVVEPTVVYMGTKTLNPLLGVPLQLAIKNKNTRNAVVDETVGEKSSKGDSNPYAYK